MNVEDFTGFIIAILAMIYFIYQSYTARAAEANADESSEEQGDVKKLLRELNIEVDEEAVAERPYRQPPPKPKRVEEKVVQPQPEYVYVEQPIKRPKEITVTQAHGLGSISDNAYDHDYSVETLVLPSVIPLDYNLSSRPSRGKAIIDSLSAKNDLIIIHDIMEPPKGLW